MRVFMDAKRAPTRQGIEVETTELAEARKRQHEPKGARAMGDENQNGQGGGAGGGSDDAPIGDGLTAAQERIVQGAINGRLSRFEKKIEAMFEKKIAILSKTVAATHAPAAPDDVAKLRETLAQREETLAQRERELREVHEQTRTANLRQQALQALAAKGVTGVKAESLLALWAERGHLSVDDEGAAHLQVARVRTKGGQAELLPFALADGIAEWAMTDEAKQFLPAPGGNRPRPTPSQVRPPVSPRTPRVARDLDGQLNDALAAMSPDQRDALSRPVRGSFSERKTLEALEARGLDITKV